MADCRTDGALALATASRSQFRRHLCLARLIGSLVEAIEFANDSLLRLEPAIGVFAECWPPANRRTPYLRTLEQLFGCWAALAQPHRLGLCPTSLTAIAKPSTATRDHPPNPARRRS